MDIVREGIEASLRATDSPETWLDPRQGNLSKLVYPDVQLRSNINLHDEEKAVFEYYSNETYSLITSKRVLSITNGVMQEVNLNQVISTRKFSAEAPGVSSPWKTLKIVDEKGKELFVEFEKGNPTYFAMIFIENMAWKLRKGVWYLNPKETWR